MNKELKQKVFKIILGILIALIVILLAFEYFYRYSYILRDPKRIKEFVLSYGKFSVLVFLLIQVIQVVVFFIPGEFVQVAGGYIYGTALGSILSTVGILIGSAVTYIISSTFAKKYVKDYFAKKNDKVTKIIKKITSKYVIFFIYLIPGIPKDIVGYLCGITEIGFADFIIYSTLGRLPGIFISALFGYQIYKADIKKIIIIAGIMVILFIIGVLRGEFLLNKVNKFFSKHKILKKR